ILIQWLRPPRDLTVVDEPVPDPDPEPFVDTLPDPLLPKGIPDIKPVSSQTEPVHLVKLGTNRHEFPTQRDFDPVPKFRVGHHPRHLSPVRRLELVVKPTEQLSSLLRRDLLLRIFRQRRQHFPPRELLELLRVLLHLPLVPHHPILPEKNLQARRRTHLNDDVLEIIREEETAPRLCTAELCRRSYKESGGSPTRYVPTPETSTAPPAERHHGDGLVVVREEGEVVHDVARERVNAAADDRRSGGFLLNRRFEIRHHEPRRVAEFRQRVDHLSSDGGGRVEVEDGLDLDEEAREGLVHVEEPEHFLRREFLDLGRVLREGEESQRSFLCDVGEGGFDYVEGRGEDVIGEKPLSEKEGPNG
ncbi:LOW QUALITY PROTEIN: hypothetical protein HID58_051137, partial [Brassica napus]